MSLIHRPPHEEWGGRETLLREMRRGNRMGLLVLGLALGAIVVLDALYLSLSRCH